MVVCVGGGAVAVFVFFAFLLQLNLRKLLRSARNIVKKAVLQGSCMLLEYIAKRGLGLPFPLLVEFFFCCVFTNSLFRAFGVLLSKGRCFATIFGVRQVSLHAGVDWFVGWFVSSLGDWLVLLCCLMCAGRHFFFWRRFLCCVNRRGSLRRLAAGP